MTSSARLLDVDRCLLRDSALLTLVRPDAAGYLYKRSNLSGWYREFEITDAGGKVHVLRAGSDAEMHWWVQLFTISRNKIPPAKPIAPAVPPAMSHTNNALQPLFTFVDPHLKVDHVLCIVHGIGVSPQLLASNIKHLQESYADVMEKVFPDLQFRVEMLPVHWRVALTKLDIHQKLHAVVPSTPVPDDANPLRQFMVHRIVDYVYYTHPRYRRHILREVCSQLNAQIDAFRMRRPDFNGTISVMGHSLGAALCYELMCRKVYDDQALLESERMRLNFDAANLFCLGNPLGTFLALDPSIGLNANMHHLPFRLFNIYKFHDPIATRLEPLSDISNMHRPPVVVPCWFNMGLRETTSQWLGGLWPRQSKASQPESEHAKPPTASASPKSGSDDNPDHSENDSRRGLSPSPSRPALSIDCPASYSQRASAGELELRQRSSDVFSDVQGQHDGTPDDYNGLRLDYALQMSSTIEEVSTSWSALKAHTDYWENRDAMLFMVSRMLKSAFAIGDDVDDRAAISLSDRIIDEDILMKIPNGEFAQTPKWGRQKSQGVLLEDTVRQVVERIVDEAVAAHELMKLHPNVRMRGGGIAGRSPAVSKTDMGKGAGDSGSGDQSRGGWAAYLRGGWFGSDSSSKK